MTAKLIILDGPDGVGKSYTAAVLQTKIQGDYLAAADDSQVNLWRDPGATALGERLRALVLDPDVKACTEAVFFMFTAARAELLEQVNRHLNFGHTVILDRLWPSTWAYQGFGLGVPLPLIQDSSRYLMDKYIPREQHIHYVFLTATREVRRARLDATGNRGKDRFESKPEDFWDRLDEGYRHAEQYAEYFSEHRATVTGVDTTTRTPEDVLTTVLNTFPSEWVHHDVTLTGLPSKVLP